MVLEEEPAITVVGEASDGAAALDLVAPSATHRLLDAFAHKIPDPRSPDASHAELEHLTAREREILVELAGGFSNAEIRTGLRR